MAALVVISVFMVVEAIGGFISGSLALIADATHMLTDALALALAVSAHWFARRPADQRKHFGYRRTQVLAAFVNGLALSLLLAWIVFEAVKRFFNPVEVDWSIMLVVAIVGLLANAAAFFLLHGAKDNDINIRGAMLHVVSDLLGSVAAILAAIVIAFSGWMKIDPLLSIVVAGLIARSAFRLLQETGHILLEGAPENINVQALIEDMKTASPDVKDIHHVQIWQLTPDQPRLTMHARVNSPEAAADTLQKLQMSLKKKYGIVQSTIQIEFNEDCPFCADNPAQVQARAASRDTASGEAAFDNSNAALEARLAGQR